MRMLQPRARRPAHPANKSFCCCYRHVGVVVRVDPLRTLIATDDLNTVAVPNKLIADMVVINRSRAPNVATASTVGAYMREVRFRMRVPGTALDKLEVRRR